MTRFNSAWHSRAGIGSMLAMTVLAGTILATQSGCLGLVANLAHAVGADKIPAEYEGLKGSKVAVVTVTDSSQYSDDTSARILSRKVGEIITREIKQVRLVREDQVEQWRDTNGWDAVDFLSVGRGVEAEKVIGIELTGLRLRDGATLYRGRANVMISVIDVKSGDIVYQRDLEEFTYPVNAGQYTSETTESRFRKLYLKMLAQKIARIFYPYDLSETFALDGAIASQ